MSRRTADDTRRELIDAGLQLLFERGAAVGVQHIKLQEVLRRVGLTTGAAYRIWADQTEYQRDLAVAAVRRRVSAPASGTGAIVDRLIEAGASADDIVRVTAAGTMDMLEGFRTRPYTPEAEIFITVLALRMTATTWPELAEASADRHAESVRQFGALYERTLARMGYRLRTPYTIELFAEAAAALTEGFAIRAAEGLPLPGIVIGDDDEGPSGEWSLFGLAMRALVREFTVRDDRAGGAGPVSASD